MPDQDPSKFLVDSVLKQGAKVMGKLFFFTFEAVSCIASDSVDGCQMIVNYTIFLESYLVIVYMFDVCAWCTDTKTRNLVCVTYL